MAGLLALALATAACAATSPPPAERQRSAADRLEGSPPPANDPEADGERRFPFKQARARRDAGDARRARERHEAELARLEVTSIGRGACDGLGEAEIKSCPIDLLVSAERIEDTPEGARVLLPAGTRDAHKLEALIACHAALGHTKAAGDDECPLFRQPRRTRVREESGHLVVDIAAPTPEDIPTLRAELRGMLGR